VAALARRGLRVGVAKVGPDFIDPGYHALAAGRPSRNLDSWICGPDAIAPLAAQAAAGTDLLVVEGVMGLFDGAAGPSPASYGLPRGGQGGASSTPGPRLPPASTAEVAALLDAPVVLVVDASAMAGSVAPLVHGFATYATDVRVAGVVCNNVASEGHAELLAAALEATGLPLLGSLARDDALRWRDRHLGLVPVAERPDEVRRSLELLAAAVARALDLDAVVRLAASAPRRRVPSPPRARRVGRCRLGVAAGPAFTFSYPDNLEQLEAAGAEVVPFDPTADGRLPERLDALVLGGGFPEVFASEISANVSLLEDLRGLARRGAPIWAECGGLLLLAEELDGHRLSGVVDARAAMGDRLTLGYRVARVRRDSPLAAAGEELLGHEFHYSTLEPPGDGLELSGRGRSSLAGHLSPSVFASYLHLHLGADPAPAERFVARATAGSLRP
jgi:cobyrinic acid a,c-diamide synthase